MKKYWILILALVLIIAGLFLNLYYGDMMSAGGFARNYFSAGNFSVGIFSAGIFSAGIFSVGIFSIGVFSLGIFNIGLYAVGLFLIGWRKKYMELKRNECPEA
ncbi:MAG: hypothetical protein V2I46_07650 [Bacteroides sp.]|nr:hypothetical protein [Bacteroides sp.]